MNKASFWLSVAMGLFISLASAVILFFVDSSIMYLALFAGILFAITLYIVLIINIKVVEKKYKVLEYQIPNQVLHTADANLRLGKKVLAVRLHFCKDHLVILSVEQKPWLQRTIFYSDIVFEWDAASPYSFGILTDKNETFSIQVAAAELVSALRSKVGLEI